MHLQAAKRRGRQMKGIIMTLLDVRVIVIASVLFIYSVRYWATPLTVLNHVLVKLHRAKFLLRNGLYWEDCHF